MTEEQKPGTRRSATVPLPYKLAVNPNGRIVKVRLATNISNPVFMQDDGEWVMRKRAEKEGWCNLEDVCGEAEQTKIEEYFAFDEKNFGAVRRMPEVFVPEKIKRMRSQAAKTPEFPGFAAEYKKEDAPRKTGTGAKG